MTSDDLIDAVRAALDTDETGENLVDVARAAKDAEVTLSHVVLALRRGVGEAPEYLLERIRKIVGEQP